MLTIKDSEILSTVAVDKHGKPTDLRGGISSYDLVRVNMKDGRVITLVRDGNWSEHDHARAQKVAAAYITKCRVKSGDLGTAFVTSGINPGLLVIANSPAAVRYQGAICQTASGEFIFWLDNEEQ